MVDHVTKEQIQAARKADLYDFCLTHHPDDFKKEGNSLRFKHNKSISIKRGYSGYTDFATEEKGNSIKFLTEYLGYGFVDAVNALTQNDMTASNTIPNTKKKQTVLNPDPFLLPSAVSGSYTQLLAYLTKTRHIPAYVVQKMIDHRILYQEKDHNNAVFVNPERTMAEIHGTLSGSSFKQSMYKDSRDAFWWFKSGSTLQGRPSKTYICESAIDAMSLYAIHENKKANLPVASQVLGLQTLYVSLSGVANTQKIDRIIKNTHGSIILAVDNDPAGHALCEKYKGIDRIITDPPPDPFKDWNEMLQSST